MYRRMSCDRLAWPRNEANYKTWIDYLLQESSLREIGKLIVKHRPSIPRKLYPSIAGAFNMCMAMEFEVRGFTILRFPQPGNVVFPEEKVKKEVAVIRFLAGKTSIPLPLVLYSGMANESPAGLGPFLLMSYIKNDHNMTASLNTPGFAKIRRPILNPSISEKSLHQNEDGSWMIEGRPLTLNMNELISIGNLPLEYLISDTYTTSTEYFTAIAEMNITRVRTQISNAGTTGNDYREKYIARLLFRKLARDRRLSHSGGREANPFRLYCDDLRPSNVLMDKHDVIVGVIDWEFTYAAPIEFSHSPPWWLLIETPEKWPNGIDDWVQEYGRKLDIFLDEMR